MDTTKTHIKMCKKAVEIQKLEPCKTKVFEEGNWYYYQGKVCIQEYEDVMDNAIWLPRQDQLQEIAIFERDRLGGRQTSAFELLDAFHIFCCVKTTGMFHEEEFQLSMEQLWLAFVMKEKYGKLWNGEDWVKNG